MDGRRFDALTRGLATRIPRRNVLQALAGGIACIAGGLAVDKVDARPRPHCRKAKQTCVENEDCCSGYCPSVPRAHRHRICHDCASGIVCGDICCPENALNGCTEIEGPFGPIIGCACPNGFYDHETNTCIECKTTCSTDADCCDVSCVEGLCCSSGVVCGGVCCPSDALGFCSPADGPNGQTESCACPKGTYYDFEHNNCHQCAVDCKVDDDCCSGGCRDGKCCHDGDIVCGGRCVAPEECQCPPGTACAGSATCTSFGHTITAGCCPYPQFSYCCADSDPGKGDGFSGCCLLEDCPDSCSNGAVFTRGGSDGLNCTPENGLECCENTSSGGNATSNFDCILNGHPCNDTYDCCSDNCVNGVCACARSGAPCPQMNSCCGGPCVTHDNQTSVCP